MIVELKPVETTNDIGSRTLINAPGEFEKPMDKRSGLVDRRRALRQVVCYICCAEFGTNSLTIHHRTCLKKHAWGLDANVLHEDGIDKKKAEKNRKLCVEPGNGPELPMPTAKSSGDAFEAYNKAALEAFFEHSKHCLFCREKNVEALEAARAAEEARRKAAEDEEARLRALAGQAEADEAARLRRLAEEEEAHRLHELEAMERALAEAEAHRLEEEELARRRAELERQRLALEAAARDRELAHMLEEERLARLREEEDEARRKRLLTIKAHKNYLHKGEGKVASTEAGKVHRQKKAEEIAKQDISNFSLLHAKKDGLLVDNNNKHQGHGDGNQKGDVELELTEEDMNGLDGDDVDEEKFSQLVKNIHSKQQEGEHKQEQEEEAQAATATEVVNEQPASTEETDGSA